jgi:hypothetical protein
MAKFSNFRRSADGNGWLTINKSHIPQAFTETGFMIGGGFFLCQFPDSQIQSYG